MTGERRPGIKNTKTRGYRSRCKHVIPLPFYYVLLSTIDGNPDFCTRSNPLVNAVDASSRCIHTEHSLCRACTRTPEPELHVRRIIHSEYMYYNVATSNGKQNTDEWELCYNVQREDWLSYHRIQYALYARTIHTWRGTKGRVPSIRIPTLPAHLENKQPNYICDTGKKVQAIEFVSVKLGGEKVNAERRSCRVFIFGERKMNEIDPSDW